MPTLLLASGSPRRKELLHQVGLPFQVVKPDVDETMVDSTDPAQLVSELARRKGEAVTIEDDQVVISADTIVSFQDQILTKPDNRADAFAKLAQLRGKWHKVYTGVMIRSLTKQRTFMNETSVQFWDVSDKVLNDYLATGEWKDKAGGYGIQSSGAVFVKQLIGDYYNVVGLPLSVVVRELQTFGISPFQ
ncbi:Maf family protein [Aquibacillus sediminis]|uniref:Maf family protein n=1 Tax=Aquibacillus sediminis TaxID=2574734 RepID=UPI001109BB87|nr:Maf family protein [Aquibacillus sediminis]